MHVWCGSPWHAPITNSMSSKGVVAAKWSRAAYNTCTWYTWMQQLFDPLLHGFSLLVILSRRCWLCVPLVDGGICGGLSDATMCIEGTFQDPSCPTSVAAVWYVCCSLPLAGETLVPFYISDRCSSALRGWSGCECWSSQLEQVLCHATTLMLSCMLLHPGVLKCCAAERVSAAD